MCDPSIHQESKEAAPEDSVVSLEEEDPIYGKCIGAHLSFSMPQDKGRAVAKQKKKPHFKDVEDIPKLVENLRRVKQQCLEKKAFLEREIEELVNQKPVDQIALAHSIAIGIGHA